MKNTKPMSACIISMCLALLLMLFTYVAFAKVDLVYVKDGTEICRQDNVSVFSVIDNPADNVPDGIIAEGEELAFTYADGDKTVDFDHTDFKFRVSIGKLIINNLIGFKWSESSQIIVMTAK